MKLIFLTLISIYQRTLSKVTRPSCRFLPTCSQYAYEAITKYGLIKGTIMGTYRLIRCNPFNKGGYDPIP